MQKYKIINILGDGAFGTVYKAVNNKTKEVVAIKKMKSKYKNWEECLQLREIKSLRKLTHPNIIQMKEVLLVSEELHLVFQYLQTNLYDEYCARKNKNNPFSEQEIKNMLFQLASALAHMHRNGFFHRDLKPENILIAGSTLKLCDFGLAREIRSRPPFTDYVSTRWYRSPQLLLRSTNYNSPVDVFAFGCIAAELYNLSPLFPGSNDGDQLTRIVKVLGTPQVAEWPQGYKLAKVLGYTFPIEQGVNLMDLVPTLSLEALDLLRNTMKYSSRRRLTMSQILKHSYFEGITLNLVHNKQEKEKQILFEQTNSGKVLDSSNHEKQLQEFRMTKAKFRQTRRQNAQQSDPLKLIEKHTPWHSNLDPTEDIDDIIKELQQKKKKERSAKELFGYRQPPMKVSRQRFYTEADNKKQEEKEKDYIYNRMHQGKTDKSQEGKKYSSNHYELGLGFKKEGKSNIFSYGFQPASLPSLVPNNNQKGHYSVTPVANTKSKAGNISLNGGGVVYKDVMGRQAKGLFPAILPFRY